MKEEVSNLGDDFYVIDTNEVEVMEVQPKKKNNGFSIESMYNSLSTPTRDAERLLKSMERFDHKSSETPKRKKEVSRPVDLQIEKEIKKRRKKFNSFIPTTSSEDMLGFESLDEMASLLLTNLGDTDFDMDAPRSVLLSGPQGSGKTMFATSLAGDVKATLLRVPVADLVVSPVVGSEKESAVKEALQEATSLAPCVLLLENLDALSSREGGLSKGTERKVCDQLEAALAELKDEAECAKGVLVLAETRNPLGLDSSLRSGFEAEVFMPVLGKQARRDVLKVLCPDVAPDFDFDEIALRTSSYVAGDLKELVKKAKHHAWRRIVVDNLGQDAFRSRKTFLPRYNAALKGKSLHLCCEDFLASLLLVTPTLKRQGFPSVPDTKWEDVGGLEDIKDELGEKILGPMQYGDLHDQFGAKKPNGILLWGPPGCGKTLLAKAVANHAGVNLYAVMGPELLNMYQGESERAIREVFKRAASVAPCVIFFDEFDCICPRRNAGADSGSKMNIVNTLLVEMNGFKQRKEVFVMAATNRPDMLDPAVMRPGRFDTSLFVGLPDLRGRVAILNACTKNGTKPNLAADVNLEEIGAWCEDFSGADCAQLVYMASKSAIAEVLGGEGVPREEGEVGTLFKRHFVAAIQRVSRSVGPEEQKKYLRMKTKFEVSRKTGKQVMLEDDSDLPEAHRGVQSPS